MDQLDQASQKKLTLFILKVSVVAAIGGLLFGYDTAVIAGVIGYLEIKFNIYMEIYSSFF